MEREIKFRAWDKDKGDMVYFYPLSVDSTNGFWADKDGVENYRIYANRDAEKVNGYNHDDFNEDVETVLMQYTGLKDKNGKEIYFGDWVEAQWRGKEIKMIRGEVIEDEYMTCIRNHVDGEIYSVNRLISFEVIGNIWENPELIK